MRESVAVSVVDMKLLCILNLAVCFYCHHCCGLPKTEDALSLDTDFLLSSPEALRNAGEELGATM